MMAMGQRDALFLECRISGGREGLQAEGGEMILSSAVSGGQL